MRTFSKDIMLDLETYSVVYNSVVVAIGACRFDISSGIIGEHFYVNVDSTDCEAHGLVTDQATLRWWAQQEKAARDALKTPEPIGLKLACLEFRAWVKTMPGKNYRLWGNGVGFDNVILRNAFDAVGVKFPVAFWDDRDVRTIVALGPKGIKSDVVRTGTKHNALDDAIFQAQYTAEIYKRLRH